MNNAQLYLDWFAQKKPLCKPRGLYFVGTQPLYHSRRGILPLVRVYWKSHVLPPIFSLSKDQRLVWREITPTVIHCNAFERMDSGAIQIVTPKEESPAWTFFRSLESGDVVWSRSGSGKGTSSSPVKKRLTVQTIENSDGCFEILFDKLQQETIDGISFSRSSHFDRNRQIDCDKLEFPQSWETEWAAFLRADQLLQALDEIHDYENNPRLFIRHLENLIKIWFIPLDFPVKERPEVLASRVETIRLLPRLKTLKKSFTWTRAVSAFPDSIRRANHIGLDPVNTVENQRAGLTRFLSPDFFVGGNGQLQQVDQGRNSSNSFSQLVRNVPFYYSNAPRRMMLGASLQTKSLELVDSFKEANDHNSNWIAPNAKLRVCFSSMNGWTHEDAIVLTKSCSLKLAATKIETYDVFIPSSIGHTVVQKPKSAGSEEVERPAIRAFIDLFAMGFNRSKYATKRDKKDTERLKQANPKLAISQDGWLEVGLKNVPMIGGECELVSHEITKLSHDQNFREIHTFKTRKILPLMVGDKLSTPMVFEKELKPCCRASKLRI